MYKKIQFIFVFYCLFCFFGNMDGVYAAGGYCERDVDIQQAFACDYKSSGIHGSAEYTLLFVKNANGYCSEVDSMELYIDGSDWGEDWMPTKWASNLFGSDASSSYDDERRKVTTFELSDNDYSNAFNNGTCPRIKTVFTTNGFNKTGLKSLIVTTPGLGLIDDLQCGFSANVAYWDSFCLISDGSNFREVDSSDVQDVVDDANDDREGPNTEYIQNWAKENGYNDVYELGDPCSIISDDLLELLQNAFFLISVIGIILVVVMTALSFVKAVVGSDDEKLRDALKHLVTRIIVIIILLLLPMILDFIISIINTTGEVSINKDGDVFCDVTNASS